MDDLETLFPGLRDSGYVVTSPEDIRYNIKRSLFNTLGTPQKLTRLESCPT